ncbi:MAG: ribonuclease H-like domain-containing protein [Anaerolineales bacterium]
MNDLYHHLKTLGIEVGVTPLESKKRETELPADLLGGQVIENLQGNLILIENQFNIDTPSIQHAISPIFIGWATSLNFESVNFSDFTIIDIETTGMLGWGAVYAFLIGLGNITTNGILIRQYLITNPAQEMAQLIEIENQIAKAKGIITYNGKSFDIPIISNRYRFYRTHPPFDRLAHLDLLHLTRRIWKERLPNRALRNIEAEILDVQRAENDIPGWLIPQIYSQYLQSQQAEVLLPVLYHNQMDVYSLGKLFIHLNTIIENPNLTEMEYLQDQISLARFYAHQKHLEKAKLLYQKCIERAEDSTQKTQLFEELAYLYKKSKEYINAIPLWEQAAHLGSINAHIELAKYYEHIAKDNEKAIHVTIAAINLLESIKFNSIDRLNWQSELQYRLERLQRMSKSYKTNGGKS